jgi:tetratricopeptide (TPR) repeat protein
MSIDPKRVQSIFVAAADLPTAHDRAAYLDQACAGDAQLRHRVDALLQAHDNPDSWLPPPAARPEGTVDLPPAAGSPGAGPPETAGTEQPGTVLAGRYKLLEQIGEGGMGAVWMAQQTEPVKRLVAVKLIKAGMDSKHVLARFEAERQALALMDHANIARVLDAGTTGAGRPYFVMDLVKGVPITRYCDAHRLTPRQRLELFLPVCQAVQHAHQKGIIHRDLKPSNVLVALYDGKPVPKVIDFGVAKAAGQTLTEKTLVTGFGAIVGTLEYMSPEQAEINQLDIDTRSDIYSLGVLLYELLAGSPPFSRKELEKGGLLEMLRVIREQEPSKPSTKLSTAEGLPTLAANRGTEPAKLTKLLRGELDWIVMKALEKDRNRRYDTANGFALDVQRYLADEAVQACPPRATYRLRKFARKNRKALAAAAAFAILLTGATVFSTWQAARARAAQKDALAARDREAELRQQAERASAESQAMFDFVKDRILAAARPKGRQGGLGPDVKLRDAVEAAAAHVGTSFARQPLVEARLRRILGSSSWYWGDGKAAEKQYEQAVALFTRLLGPDDRETLACSNDLAIGYALQQRFDEAIDLNLRVLARLRATVGPDDEQSLRTMNNLGRCYFELKRYPEAVKIHQEVLALQQVKLGPDHASTLRTMTNLANCYGRADRPADALALREKTVALQEAKLGPDDYDTLMSRHNLANSYRKAERYAEALKQDEETLARRRATLGDNHPDTLCSLWSVGEDLLRLERGTAAIPLLDQCLRRAAGRHVHQNFWQVANLRLQYFAKAKKVEGCRTTAEIWEKQQRTDADSLYQAACCRAVTATVLRATDPSPATVKQADAEADRAMAWLRQAVVAGYKYVTNLKQNKDFDALRDRAGFQELLGELKEP